LWQTHLCVPLTHPVAEVLNDQHDRPNPRWFQFFPNLSTLFPFIDAASFWRVACFCLGLVHSTNLDPDIPSREDCLHCSNPVLHFLLFSPFFLVEAFESTSDSPPFLSQLFCPGYQGPFLSESDPVAALGQLTVYSDVSFPTCRFCFINGPIRWWVRTECVPGPYEPFPVPPPFLRTPFSSLTTPRWKAPLRSAPFQLMGP